ncbi:UNVERIFIED_CONTAM: hypothetical protein RF648_18895, partial [Kocuria sp. CPCC 205274]
MIVVVYFTTTCGTTATTTSPIPQSTSGQMTSAYATVITTVVINGWLLDYHYLRLLLRSFLINNLWLLLN